MDRQIENTETGERVIVTDDSFQAYTNGLLRDGDDAVYGVHGRMFKYGDGRLYEYDDNGKLMETAWTWVTDNPRHTPGPWVTEGRTVFTVSPMDDGETLTTIVADCPMTALQGDEAPANAALIAAAPELLFAAIAALDCLERPHAERDENRVRVMLDVAVAKAEGK